MDSKRASISPTDIVISVANNNSPPTAKEGSANDSDVQVMPARTIGPISAKDIVVAVDPPITEFASNLEGALWWLDFGYRVMPLVTGLKRPALAYDRWLPALSVDAVRSHWARNPNDDVGAVLESNQLLLDADTPEAEAALARLERQFGVVPALIIKTRRGQHHHYRLSEGTFAKPDSHSTDEFPERIDVRSGNSSIMLTPSKDKSIQCLAVSSWSELPLVGQDFVDAVFQHNGRPAPRPMPDDDEDEPVERSTDIGKLSQLLEHIDPDCGYQDWLHVMIGLRHATQGSEEGLDLADRWSKKGGSYGGRREIETKWRSFSNEVSNPITVATLIARARDGGADIDAIMSDGFKPCTTVVVRPPAAESPPAKISPLRQYSLIGQAEKYEKLAQAATPLLGDVCQSGEATVLYAKHNVGKTLLTLHMILEAVEQCRIAADAIYYINADDSSAGFAMKLSILDEIRAHTLVPGQGGFKIEDLAPKLMKAVEEDSARGTLVIIDTLKKFADLMNKKQASDFANVCRQFVAAGGTVVGLAHTNKRTGDDGKAIHAGTSDILDDFDAGYVIDEVPSSGRPGERFVEFTQKKARSGGVQTVAYAYAAEDNVSYAERLASVRLVDPADLDGLKRVEEERSDAEIIAVVVACISEGVMAKMALRNAVADRAGISRRAATKVIERYTGDTPGQHRWSFSRIAHGKMLFTLLDKDDGADGPGGAADG